MTKILPQDKDAGGMCYLRRGSRCVLFLSMRWPISLCTHRMRTTVSLKHKTSEVHLNAVQSKFICLSQSTAEPDPILSVCEIFVALPVSYLHRNCDIDQPMENLAQDAAGADGVWDCDLMLPPTGVLGLMLMAWKSLKGTELPMDTPLDIL